MAIVYSQKNLTATTGFNSTAEILISGLGVCAIQLSGTFTATVLFEATTDGDSYAALSMTPSAGGVAVTSATAAGMWQGDCGGYYAVRARCSAYTSGVASAAVAAGVSVLPAGSGNLSDPGDGDYAVNWASGTPSWTNTPEFAGLGIGTAGVAGKLTAGDDGAGNPTLLFDTNSIVLSVTTGVITGSFIDTTGFAAGEYPGGYYTQYAQGGIYAASGPSVFQITNIAGPLQILTAGASNWVNDTGDLTLSATTSGKVIIDGYDGNYVGPTGAGLLVAGNIRGSDDAGGLSLDSGATGTNIVGITSASTISVTASTALALGAVTGVTVSAGNDIDLYTDTVGALKQFHFDADGSSTFPGSVTATSYTGTTIPASDAGLTAGQFYHTVGVLMVKL